MNRKSLSRVFLVVLTAGLAVSPSLAQPDRPPPIADAYDRKRSCALPLLS